jgi:hypothetical protein
MEFLYMNLLEHHSEQCPSCETLLYGRFHDNLRCLRGSILMNLVLRYFVVERNGRIYSTEDHLGRPVRVEISRYYWAVHGLLRALYPRYYRQAYNGIY